jgi:hypothetical protein
MDIRSIVEPSNAQDFDILSLNLDMRMHLHHPLQHDHIEAAKEAVEKNSISVCEGDFYELSSCLAQTGDQFAHQYQTIQIQKVDNDYDSNDHSKDGVHTGNEEHIPQ